MKNLLPTSRYSQDIRALCIQAVICCLAIIGFSAVAVSQVTNDQCFLCHGSTTFSKAITLTSGATELIPLYVDKVKYAASTHGSLSCVKCHTDITVMTHGPLGKTYGGWARFSAKNDTVVNGKERTRNYYTAAALSCSQSGCHTQYSSFTNSAHHTIWRQRQAHVRTVNGESVGEAFVGNDCNRCHTSCATCHFRTTKIQAKVGDVLSIWDSLQFHGDGTEPLKTNSGKYTEWAMDWTTNVESHTFETKADLKASNDVCQCCHIGYYKPPMSGFLKEEAPYPKAFGTNIRRHPQVQERTLSGVHKDMKCAECHTNVHAYPDGAYDWQIQGDVTCSKCHTMTNHYANHYSVDCIACHFTGFARSRGQTAHDVFRSEKTNRVRPLAVKYNEAISWYPHNIIKPDNGSCAKQCHYEGNIIGANVMTSVLISSKVPQHFELAQNYPNPVYAKTLIRYELASAQQVTLNIYNVHGIEVSTLVKRHQQPGQYQVEFDAATLPGGVYYCKMTAGSFMQVRKMLLLR